MLLIIITNKINVSLSICNKQPQIHLVIQKVLTLNKAKDLSSPHSDISSP